jgi:hypothetical protein
MNYQDMFVPVDMDEDMYLDFDTKHKKAMNDLQSTNKHFHKEIKRIRLKTGRKSISIEYYSSGPINTTITHALSGVKEYGFLVGSSHEDLFFKVCTSTGKEPLTLFYYSPEEFEKHQSTQLSDNVKNKWREKYQKAASLRLKAVN